MTVYFLPLLLVTVPFVGVGICFPLWFLLELRDAHRRWRILLGFLSMMSVVYLLQHINTVEHSYAAGTHREAIMRTRDLLREGGTNYLESVLTTYLSENDEENCFDSVRRLYRLISNQEAHIRPDVGQVVTSPALGKTSARTSEPLSPVSAQGDCASSEGGRVFSGNRDPPRNSQKPRSLNGREEGNRLSEAH